MNCGFVGFEVSAEIALNDDGGDETKCIGEFPVGDTMPDMICKDGYRGESGK